MRTDTDIVFDAAGNVVDTVTRDVPVTYKVLSHFEFLSLFAPEKIAAALALKATTLAVFWLYYEAATVFERDHPTTIAGFGMLVSAGVYTAEETAEIRSAWPLAGT